MIVTGRLYLRPFQRQDLPAFVAYRSDPEVARYQSWDPTYSLADAEEFLAEQEPLELGQPGEWVQLAAVDRATGELCGDCALRVLDRTAELGVTLAPMRQGAGLASEALTAVIARPFSEHGMHRIYAETDDRNAGVQRRSIASASAARRVSSRPLGSRTSGRPYASTRSCTASGWRERRS